jgi:hypothetical protein
MSNVLGDVANRINFCNKLKGALGWAVNGKKEPKGVRRKNVPSNGYENQTRNELTGFAEGVRGLVAANHGPPELPGQTSIVC